MGKYVTIKPISNKVVIENAIDAFNRELEEKKAIDEAAREENRRAMKESEELFNLRSKKQITFSRFTSFSESVTNALLGECVYYVFAKSMNESLINQPNTTGIMRAMVGDFIKEDASKILSAMRTKTATLSEMYNLITETKKEIIDSIDKDDPSTFCIKKEIKDTFFDKLDDLDTESITDAIRNRVADAVNDFMTANKRDHEQIVTALQLTKDKLEEKKNAPEEVKESYQQLSKRVIGKIRNRKKSVFESMVEAMCESSVKDETLKEEFVEGSKLNVSKIVDRIQTMYTFIETVNTMKLYPIDEEYMEAVIEGLRHP